MSTGFPRTVHPSYRTVRPDEGMPSCADVSRALRLYASGGEVEHFAEAFASYPKHVIAQLYLAGRSAFDADQKLQESGFYAQKEAEEAAYQARRRGRR